MTTVEKVKDVIERTRFILQQDGGDMEFIKYEEGIVYLTVKGSCVGCSSLSYTIFDGVESILLAEVPEVIGVELV